jgi:hypothetical protein
MSSTPSKKRSCTTGERPGVCTTSASLAPPSGRTHSPLALVGPHTLRRTRHRRAVLPLSEYVTRLGVVFGGTFLLLAAPIANQTFPFNKQVRACVRCVRACVACVRCLAAAPTEAQGVSNLCALLTQLPAAPSLTHTTPPTHTPASGVCAGGHHWQLRRRRPPVPAHRARLVVR